MADSWEDMKRAKEESYFDKANKEALERLQERTSQAKPLISPVSGQPMEQLTVMGVVIDRCPVSGGIWLDHGELEQVIEHAKKSNDTKWLDGFFGSLFGPLKGAKK